MAPAPGSALESPQAVLDASGALLAGYVYLGEQPLVRYGSGGPVYYLEDAMGSVVALSDELGAEIARFSYDGFGNALDAAGPSAELPAELGGDFRVHGAWRDRETGLYHMRARYYDSGTGRFLSQ